jgi:hypothetical protein
MKRVVFVVVLLLMLPLVVAANEEVELTPESPYPNENLLCEYTSFEQGNVIEFVWLQDDVEVRRKTTDKPSDIFSLDTQKGDKITCQINLQVGRSLPIGGRATFIGNFACSDGEDNDGDGLIDFNDKGCESRSDKDEFNFPLDYCDNHPNNVFCLQLGFSDIIKICEKDVNNELCQQNPLYLTGIQECVEDASSPTCTGVTNIVPQCNGGNDRICQLFTAMAKSCPEDNFCFELTDTDKNVICATEEHYFCPEKEESQPEEQPREDDWVNPNLCSDGHDINTRWTKEDGCTTCTCTLDAEIVCDKSACVVDEEQPAPYQPFCGDGVCELDEPNTCSKDCSLPPTKKDSVGTLIAGLLIAGGTIAGLLFLRKKRR